MYGQKERLLNFTEPRNNKVILTINRTTVKYFRLKVHIQLNIYLNFSEGLTMKNKIKNYDSDVQILKIRNKNAIEELLDDDNIAFEKISVAKNLEENFQTKRILKKAKDKGIKVETLKLSQMAVRRSGKTHEVIIGYIKPTNILRFEELLQRLEKEKKQPFFLLINRIDFDTNIGVIARTAFAAGINGLIYQGETERFLNDDSVHFSLGSIVRIPLVKQNIFEAIKKLKDRGIKTVALNMNGKNYTDTNLTGSLAIVIGEEKNGISRTVTEKCDEVLSIPIYNKIESLNVAICAAVLIYEKIRQENLCFK
ncbi:RNA methyltransferase [Candidatus Dojkabacteria bacterium]|uniref:RNA methyltransferase n=1 Tax=Candidatus Dojkabacteria bacterium TaxID=2099670 RepID=A0A3M0YZG2_9BACT|nr:MAG: RNA methyltransferase [Candidatus Dojkabacteria bacterium]